MVIDASATAVAFDCTMRNKRQWLVSVVAAGIASWSCSNASEPTGITNPGATSAADEPVGAASGGSAAIASKAGSSGSQIETPVGSDMGSLPDANAAGAAATPTAGMTASAGATPTAAGAGGTIAATAGGAAPAGGSAAANAPSSEPMPAACPADSKIKVGDSRENIMVGSEAREYILHVPASYDGKTPMPLVIDWHPLFGSASNWRGSSGYAEIGDREGFVTLYPNGIDNAWNIGKCCTQSRDVDDLGFAKALVERMRSEACIDMKRVYATGVSMGGGMSHFLACNAADVFAAVAPAAFDLLDEDEEPCKPARPITVISQRGTADMIVPYQGGPSTPPTTYPLPMIHFRGAVGTLQRWAELNHCTDEPVDAGDGCQTHKQCAGGVEVTLCTTQGGGHTKGDPETGWSTLKRFSL